MKSKLHFRKKQLFYYKVEQSEEIEIYMFTFIIALLARHNAIT